MFRDRSRVGPAAAASEWTRAASTERAARGGHRAGSDGGDYGDDDDLYDDPLPSLLGRPVVHIHGVPDTDASGGETPENQMGGSCAACLGRAASTVCDACAAVWRSAPGEWMKREWPLALTALVAGALMLATLSLGIAATVEQIRCEAVPARHNVTWLLPSTESAASALVVYSGVADVRVQVLPANVSSDPPMLRAEFTLLAVRDDRSVQSIRIAAMALVRTAGAAVSLGNWSVTDLAPITGWDGLREATAASAVNSVPGDDLADADQVLLLYSTSDAGADRPAPVPLVQPPCLRALWTVWLPPHWQTVRVHTRQRHDIDWSGGDADAAVTAALWTDAGTIAAQVRTGRVGCAAFDRWGRNNASLVALAAHTDSGAVRLHSVRARASVSLDSHSSRSNAGLITLAGVQTDGTLRVHSAAADVDVSSLRAGSLWLQSVRGRLALSDARLQHGAWCRSDAGSVLVDSLVACGAHNDSLASCWIDLQSARGAVRVAVAAPVTHRLLCERCPVEVAVSAASFGGSYAVRSVAGSVTVAGAGVVPVRGGREASGRIGDGSAALWALSFAGTVRLGVT